MQARSQNRAGIAGRLILIACLLVSPSYAWNALGHQLVVQCALDELNQSKIDSYLVYNRAVPDAMQTSSLVSVSTWFDTLHRKETYQLNQMHYVTLAFSDDGSPLPPKKRNNAIFAVVQAQHLLNDPNAIMIDKGIALRILLHVTADLHQPLHATSRVSQQYPRGDLGGNLFPLTLKGRIKNLHAYWDNGGGWLLVKPADRTLFIHEAAKQLHRRWPCNLEQVDLDPNHWAEESHDLAKQFAYNLYPDSTPNKAYQLMVQDISQERIALAGCRLAAMLKLSIIA